MTGAQSWPGAQDWPAWQQAWPTWQQAWQRALYGDGGFYRRQGAPGRHFRTAAHASTSHRLLASALLQLAEQDGCRQVLDVGAGGGELLSAMAALDPGVELTGVDVADRPPGLPAQVRWLQEPPERTTDTLLVALELLDVVPCPVLEVDGDGVLREVRVEPASGTERLTDLAGEDDLAWCRRWWPVPARPGARVEVGRTRDDVWSDLVSRIDRGIALAVDYAHTAQDRPPFGSLTGFRDGDAVQPVPDGGCDLTAHVALDSVAAAGMDGLPEPQLCTQRESLHRLGLSGRRPPLELAGSDPAGYLRALSAAGEAGELLATAGLGGFTWLVQPVTAPDAAPGCST